MGVIGYSELGKTFTELQAFSDKKDLGHQKQNKNGDL